MIYHVPALIVYPLPYVIYVSLVRIFHTIQLLEILLSPRTAVPPEQLKLKGGGFRLPDFDGIDLVRERGTAQ